MDTEAFDIQRYNQAVKDWGRDTQGQLRSSINGLGVRATGTLLRSVNAKFGQRFGQVNYVGLRFARYGVFVEKGASRGHGGAKGSKWRTAQGKLKRTNPKSMGAMGTGGRSARPWFNPVIGDAVDRLADLVVNFIADASLNTIQIK